MEKIFLEEEQVNNQIDRKEFWTKESDRVDFDIDIDDVEETEKHESDQDEDESLLEAKIEEPEDQHEEQVQSEQVDKSVESEEYVWNDKYFEGIIVKRMIRDSDFVSTLSDIFQRPIQIVDLFDNPTYFSFARHVLHFYKDYDSIPTKDIILQKIKEAEEKKKDEKFDLTDHISAFRDIDRVEDIEDSAFNDLFEKHYKKSLLKARTIDLVDEAEKDKPIHEILQKHSESLAEIQSFSLQGKNSGLMTPKEQMESFLNDLPERRYLLYPWLYENTITIINGPRGMGKTQFSFGLAKVLSQGGVMGINRNPGDWECHNPSKVYYIDAEMSVYDYKRLLQTHKVYDCERNLYTENCATLRKSKDVKVNLIDPSYRNYIIQNIKRYDIEVLIIDNKTSLMPGIDENQKKEWDEINQWLLELRAMGLTIFFVTHTGKKGETIRGTSAISDNVDLVINLMKPSNHQEGDGARFKVVLDKGRQEGISLPQHILAFQKDENGDYEWRVEEGKEMAKNDKHQLVCDMLEKGYSVEKTAKAAGYNSNYIYELAKKYEITIQK